jgi:hypothetical protein
MPGFQRVNPLGEGFIRAPARLLVCPYASTYPADLAQIIQMAATSVSYVPEIQTISTTGTPTGGTFVLSFLGYKTAPIPEAATTAQIVTALSALPGIGSGGVTASGGPLPATPVVVTFAGQNAPGVQPLLVAPASGNLLTGGSAPAVLIVETQMGIGQFDPVAPWTELGSTKTGADVSRNNTETLVDVDQILTSLLGIPDQWEMTVTTALAETTLENIELAWEGGAITVDTTQSPNERHLAIGAPLAYTQRRLVVIGQKTVGPAAGLIRAHIVRLVTKSPQASSLKWDKTGPQQTVPMVFRAFADTTVSNPSLRFGEIVEQSVNG